ncbi:hypothetical protein CANCADRAFT_139734 [Tortispora caseinolytica NRRL Y-17796]|uniref:DNA topoisomerase (ATP-hydrolyzing) n=1 Tax=Tortispora caseinolytica NRRL Y-17796 TaxID=767744 RepID=A0A1E4TCL3_9ASCO|nr:hypothetical protein CANCADRAFT_139734 [Tortispora caseinolytica NRRL Y-17796]
MSSQLRGTNARGQSKRSILKRLLGQKAYLISSLKNSRELKIGDYSFPGKTESECRQFTMLLFLLNTAIECLENGVTVTRRNVYYQNVELFRSQYAVDLSLKKLGEALKIDSSLTGIVPGSKGLVIGALRLKCVHPECEVDCSEITVLPGKPVEAKLTADLDSILIVEKEAIMHSLVESGYHQNNRVILCGKGYPDKATISLMYILLHEIEKRPRVKVQIAVDADPHGLDILRVYLRCVPQQYYNRIEWVGSKIDHSKASEVISCTEGDRKRAINVLSTLVDNCNSEWHNHWQSKEWCTQLQRNLFFNAKREMSINDILLGARNV